MCIAPGSAGGSISLEMAFHSFSIFITFYVAHKQYLYENSHKAARQHTISKNVMSFCYNQFSKDVFKSVVKCRKFLIIL